MHHHTLISHVVSCILVMNATVFNLMADYAKNTFDVAGIIDAAVDSGHIIFDVQTRKRFFVTLPLSKNMRDHSTGISLSLFLYHTHTLFVIYLLALTRSTNI